MLDHLAPVGNLAVVLYPITCVGNRLSKHDRPRGHGGRVRWGWGRVPPVPKQPRRDGGSVHVIALVQALMPRAQVGDVAAAAAAPLLLQRGAQDLGVVAATADAVERSALRVGRRNTWDRINATSCF